jgi:hypothetical protein
VGIRIDQERARARLHEAVDWAADASRPVPYEWLEITERVSESRAKTLVAVLGTALLARATDENVDALALKQDFSPTAYSARTLCHQVLVPTSKDSRHPFHLGATGREPLNNQPFFRFDHLESIDRTKWWGDLDYLRDCLRNVNRHGADYAFAALAAFIRSRMAAHGRWAAAIRELVPDHTEVVVLLDELEDFLREGTTDRPLRLQAVVGGLVRLTELEVSAQAVHDPSRHAPGDVHVPDEHEPHWAAEVRGKHVPLHEAVDFVERCASWGTIRSCWVIVLAQEHEPLDRAALAEIAHRRGMLTIVVEDLLELVAAVAGHPSVEPALLNHVGDTILSQLASMRAGAATLNEWRSRWLA